MGYLETFLVLNVKIFSNDHYTTTYMHMGDQTLNKAISTTRKS